MTSENQDDCFLFGPDTRQQKIALFVIREGM